MSTPRPTPPDIRAYLEIRTSSPGSPNDDGTRQIVSSTIGGTAQPYRLDAAALADAPLDPAHLTPLVEHREPVGAAYLPGGDGGGAERLLLVTDEGGNERHQLFLGSDAPARPQRVGDLDPLVVDPEHIHRPGGVSRDGALLAYATNARTGHDFDVRVRDLRSGEDREVVAAGGWWQPAGFTPDGRWLAATELTGRAGDNRTHLVDLDDGTRTEIAPHDDGPEASVGAPTWMPDGRTGFVATSVGAEHARIMRITRDGARVVLEPALDLGWDAGAALDWTGTHLLVTANVDGWTHAALHDPVTLAHRADVPLPGRGVASGFRFARDGRWLSYAFSSGSVPGDAWRLDLGDGGLTRMTTSPCAVDPDTFVEPSLVRVTSFDGVEIPAFVYRPRNATGRRAPVVMLVHGGPESQFRPAFGGITQYLVASGYAVVAPNVRGSTGYGRTFQHLDDVERRLDSVADLAALHDWIAASGDLDPDRCALYGGSYGGYMVLAGLAFQPERWAAGVDVVGIASLVTFLENTASWRRAFREREYGSLERDRAFLEHASPLTHVGAMRAPLFIIHGRNDPRVPVGEAEQIHAELRGRGVRSELLIYDDEGHGLAKLGNRLDAYPRAVAFLDEVL